MRKIGTILVTGGLGFMGSDFIKYLLASNEFEGHIVNLDLFTYAADPKALSDYEADSRYTLVKGDICDAKLLRELFTKYEFDTVVHFAAESHVDRSIEDASKFIETNITGTHKLLEEVLRTKEAHFHLISTDEVYGSLGKEGFFTEESTYRPNSPYAASKAAADLLALSYYKTHGISLCISHACNNYGPNQHDEKLIPTVIKALQNGAKVPIYGDGLNVRTWMHVRDHSEAVLALLTKGVSGQVYNLDSAEEKTNLEVVQTVIDCLVEKYGKKRDALEAQITFVQDRKGHDFRYAMSLNKTKADIGWVSKTSFYEGICNVLEEKMS